MYYYYPSCNFQKFFPDTARRIRAYLSAQADVTIAGCCHVTNGLPAAGETIVTVCMSCYRLLREMRPDCRVISLYEFLLTRKDFPWPDMQGQEMILQDCFRARGCHELQEAVRNCLHNMHVSYEEAEPSRDEADYDGSFLLHLPNAQNQGEAPHYFTEYLPQHLHVLPPEKWPDYYAERARTFSGKPVVLYCNTCTTSLKQGGADAVHIAELLFPEA